MKRWWQQIAGKALETTVVAPSAHESSKIQARERLQWMLEQKQTIDVPNTSTLIESAVFPPEQSSKSESHPTRILHDNVSELDLTDDQTLNFFPISSKEQPTEVQSIKSEEKEKSKEASPARSHETGSPATNTPTLRDIKGIGPKSQLVLNRYQIFTIQQLSELTDQQCEEIKPSFPRVTIFRNKAIQFNNTGNDKLTKKKSKSQKIQRKE